MRIQYICKHLDLHETDTILKHNFNKNIFKPEQIYTVQELEAVTLVAAKEDR